MEVIEILDILTVKPKIKIIKQTQEEAEVFVQEEAQVIVHCTINSSHQSYSDRIRIWKSTFLFQKIPHIQVNCSILKTFHFIQPDNSRSR